MMRRLNFMPMMIAAALIIATGCTEPKNSEKPMESSNSDTTRSIQQHEMAKEKASEYSNMAVAVVHPTKDNNAMGTVTFEGVSNGVQVHAQFTGLPEGDHGFHIHLYGDCRADDGTSAGTHFNFEGSSTNPPADIDRITGNLGVLTAGKNGKATADTLIKNASLKGGKSILGRAVIVHAKANDPSQPPIGAAGARLGCGVIGSANPDYSGSGM